MRVDEARFVAGEEQRPRRDLARLGEAAGRQVDEPASAFSGSFANSSWSSGVFTGPGQSAFTRMPLAGELDAQLARHRQHAALRRGVGDLRDGGAHHRHERGGVDDRPAAVVEQVRDAELAAQEDRLEVDVLHPVPGLDRGVEDRGVVLGRDAGVVEQHVDLPELLARLRVHALDLLGVGHVGLDRRGRPTASGAQVHAHHLGPLGLEQPRRLGADAARGAGDHADLALQSAAISPSVA